MAGESTMPTFMTGLSAVLGNLKGIFGGGSAPSVVQNTSVGQTVAQSQTTNIGSSVGGQQDLAAQLAYLLGASPTSSLPPTIGGNSSLLNGLFSTLGIATPPTTTGIGDSRYSPLGTTTSTAATSGIGINGILIFVAIGLVVLLVIKKMKRSK